MPCLGHARAMLVLGSAQILKYSRIVHLVSFVPPMTTMKQETQLDGILPATDKRGILGEATKREETVKEINSSCRCFRTSKSRILSFALTGLPTSSVSRSGSASTIFKFYAPFYPSLISAFYSQNTNIVELYSRLIKSSDQLTYYNSGIGTYVKPSRASLSYWIQLFNYSVDMAIAW